MNNLVINFDGFHKELFATIKKTVAQHQNTLSNSLCEEQRRERSHYKGISACLLASLEMYVP